MKRVLVLGLFLLFVVMGCEQKSWSAQDDGAVDVAVVANRLNVVTTIFPQYDFVREIAGAKVDLTMLLPPGSEVHSFEPTPRDIAKIQNCDLFIYVGGETDIWVERILSSMDLSQVKTIALLDCVSAVVEEVVVGMEAEDDGDEDAAFDEHVWTSPANTKLIMERLTEALAEQDAINADTYRQNCATYFEELDELDAAFRQAIAQGTRRTLVFGDRFPFRYLADSYELEYYAAFPGCATDTEPSANTVAFLIDKVQEEQIPVVFHVEMSNEKMADTICEATGARKLLFHACHMISKDEFARGVRYIDLMHCNAENMKEALR